jgi:hypothetical protein
MVIGAYCPNGDKWLFWADPKGSFKPLLNSPIHVEGTSSNAMDLWAPADFIWSSDDKYIAFNIISRGNTDMYIVNAADALKDPSVQPFQMTIGNGFLYYSPSWQPTISNNIVEEKPTSEPLTFSLTINDAETQSGFDVLEPAYVPAGYTLEGIAYDPQTRKVAMKYISQKNEGTLFIYQQRGDFVHDPAVQAYVTPIPIGNVEAEYVQGAWIYDTPQTTTPRWDPSATFYSLTWQKDAITYAIEFIGGETVTPLLLSEFVAIAESLK